MSKKETLGGIQKTAIVIGAAVVGLLGAGVYVIARGLGKQIATAVAVAKGRSS
jgi:hypothetical protein